MDWYVLLILRRRREGLIAKLIPLEVSTATSTKGDTCNSATKDTQTARDPVNIRPQRTAAQRGRKRVLDWVKQLNGSPEDVMD